MFLLQALNNGRSRIIKTGIIKVKSIKKEDIIILVLIIEIAIATVTMTIIKIIIIIIINKICKRMTV